MGQRILNIVALVLVGVALVAGGALRARSLRTR